METSSLAKPKLTIVLVDDDREYLKPAKALIEMETKRTVLVAINPYEAKEIVNALIGPTVFFVDYHLPKMNGLQLIKELREYAQVPIECILVTGAADDPKVMTESLRMGVYTFSKAPPPNVEKFNLAEAYLALVEFAEKRLELFVDKVTDTITGAYTRKGGQDMWVQVWNGMKRNKTWTSCIFIDVNDFKQFNDKFANHAPGDAMLRAVEKSIRRHVRMTDIIIRYGDEFIVILMGANEKFAVEVAERIKTYVAQMTVDVLKDISMSVSVSVGVASLDPMRLRENTDNDPKISVLDFDDLVKLADRAMYEDKAKHKAKKKSE